MNIQHNLAEKQFYVIIQGKKSVLKYRSLSSDKVLDYYSTFVPLELRGNNIGVALVKFALDYAKANRLQIIPTCPFVQKIIDRYPNYQSLIVSSNDE